MSTAIERMDDSLDNLEREVLANMAPDRDSGRSMASVRKELHVAGNRVYGDVLSDYAVVRMRERGTGLYGPSRTRIRPRRARALRFKPRGGVSYVYRAWAAGLPPARYFERARVATRPTTERIMRLGGAEIADRIWFQAGVL